ncbi:MAG: FdtA/QdtA family cupin domain-containing protein [Elusimicrobia bacterium]|nr:FdtA/QdtA family cupin domain-containing protein [Elusimicrobiota bacterium]MDY6039840.1 FdtA/QdtA family cupin domain-containing protein [Elusimicrobiaceae bacterium]
MHSTLQDATKLLNFTVRGDERGNLVALESQSREIPFEVKRVYYIYGTQAGVTRGKHAHYALKQVLTCVSGACDILLDDGKERTTVRLDSPEKGLFIDGFIWREMSNFSPDCVLMVLASEHYNEDDYVRDYTVFSTKGKND